MSSRPWLTIRHPKIIWNFETELNAQQLINPDITIDDLLDEIRRNFDYNTLENAPTMIQNCTPGWFGSYEDFSMFWDTIFLVAETYAINLDAAEECHAAMTTPLHDLAKLTHMTWEDIERELGGWGVNRCLAMINDEDNTEKASKLRGVIDCQYWEREDAVFLMHYVYASQRVAALDAMFFHEANNKTSDEARRSRSKRKRDCRESDEENL